MIQSTVLRAVIAAASTVAGELLHSIAVVRGLAATPTTTHFGAPKRSLNSSIIPDVRARGIAEIFSAPDANTSSPRHGADSPQRKTEYRACAPLASPRSDPPNGLGLANIVEHEFIRAPSRNAPPARGCRRPLDDRENARL